MPRPMARTMARTIAASPVLAGALLILVAACGSPPDQPDASTEAPIFAMLAAVPASTSLDIVTATDFAAAQRAAGIEPAAEADDPADWLQRLESGARFWPVGFGGSYADQPGWLDAFGFSIGTVTAALEVGVPDDEIKVFAGIDADAVESAARRDGIWSDALTRRRLPTGMLLDWGDGRRDDASNAARPVGEAGQMLLRGDLAVRTTASTTMESVLDSLTTTETWAGNPLVISVVTALLTTALPDTEPPEDAPSEIGNRTRGAYSLLLSDRLITSDAGAGNRIRTRTMLEPYALLGIGLGHDVEGYFGIIVLAHDTEDEAIANFDALGRILADGVSPITGERWSDTMPIRSAERRGTMVAIIVEPASPDGPVLAFLRGDSLFWSTPSY